jgi:hypothetical protein
MHQMLPPPAVEGHPRAVGARRDAGGPQTERWPEIGSGMGTKEARRTLPQASEDLLECRLGTGRHHLIVSLVDVVDTSSFSLRHATILRYAPECVEKLSKNSLSRVSSARNALISQ